MAKRKPGRPVDPLALREKILIRVTRSHKKQLEKVAAKNKRRLATFCREVLEDVSA